MKLLLIGLIRLYRLVLSPLMGGQCRFYPSCSHYAEGALCEHGAIYGSALTVWRLLRCHPWHPGGFDPVPSSSPESGGPPAAPTPAPTSGTRRRRSASPRHPCASPEVNSGEAPAGHGTKFSSV